jgi:hypothetical protein
LKFEVERLQKSREQQTRSEAKTKLVEQIDACLHSSDYSRERLRFRLLREMVQQRRLFLHRLWKSHFRQLPRPSTLLFLL